MQRRAAIPTLLALPIAMAGCTSVPPATPLREPAPAPSVSALAVPAEPAPSEPCALEIEQTSLELQSVAEGMRFLPDGALVWSGDSAVARLGDGGIALIGSNGAVSRLASAQPLEARAAVAKGLLVVTRTSLPCGAERSLHWVELDAQRTRWSSELGFDEYLPVLLHVDTEQLVVVYSSTPRTASGERGQAEQHMASLNVADGSLRWQRVLLGASSIFGVLDVVAGRILYSSDQGPIQLLDGATGRDIRQWDLDAGSNTVLDAQLGESNVALLVGRGDQTCSVDRPLWCETQLQILNAADGATRYAGPWASTWNPPRLLLDRGDAFSYLGANMGSRPTSLVVAVDAETGKERWRSAALPGAAYEAGGAMVASAERLYVCTGGGLLRALSRSDGRELGKVGVGECDGLHLLGGRLVASSYRGVMLVDEAAFAGEEREVSVRGRVAMSPFAERRLTPPFTVLLGDRYTKTDANGRFQAKLRARGILQVNASLSERERRLELYPGDPAYITLGEPSPVVVNLEIEQILE